MDDKYISIQDYILTNFSLFNQKKKKMHENDIKSLSNKGSLEH